MAEMPPPPTKNKRRNKTGNPGKDDDAPKPAKPPMAGAADQSQSAPKAERPPKPPKPPKPNQGQADQAAAPPKPAKPPQANAAQPAARPQQGKDPQILREYEKKAGEGYTTGGYPDMDAARPPKAGRKGNQPDRPPQRQPAPQPQAGEKPGRDRKPQPAPDPQAGDRPDKQPRPPASQPAEQGGQPRPPASQPAEQGGQPRPPASQPSQPEVPDERRMEATRAENEAYQFMLDRGANEQLATRVGMQAMANAAKGMPTAQAVERAVVNVGKEKGVDVKPGADQKPAKGISDPAKTAKTAQTVETRRCRITTPTSR